jgi:hypothetical protein
METQTTEPVQATRAAGPATSRPTPIADGIVLLPLWMIWAVRIRRITTDPRAA